MIHLRRAGIALAALALPLGSSLFPGAAVAHDRAHRPVQTPPDTSSISIDNVIPGTIPAKGAVVITGTLYNGSGKTWHHLSVLPQMSQYPIASTSDLANDAVLDSAQVTLSEPSLDLGQALNDLAPGKSVRFSLRIPRAKMGISGAAGPYWLGVAPIGDELQSTSLTARTFLPLLPKANKRARVNVALVVPLRETPLRTPTGVLAGASGFATDLSSRGRLGRIAEFGVQAASRPLTWLVDPALLDLADDTASGTTAYPIGPQGTALPQPAPLPAASGSATSTSTPTSSPSSTATGSPTAGPTSAAAAAELAAREAAQAWLGSVTPMLKSSATYALPYADTAVAPLVATGHASLLTAAVDQSTESMTARGITTSQTGIAPTTGALSQREWSALPPGETVFLGTSATTSSMESDGRTLFVASSPSQGGPGPTSQESALNLRQRVLAEASLTIGSASTTSLTVVLPAHWDPGSEAGIRSFFPQLTRSWLAFTELPAPSSGKASLSHTQPRASTKELAAIRAALQLHVSAARLIGALAPAVKAGTPLARQLAATVFSTVSYDASDMPVRYRVNATQTAVGLDKLLKSVRVEGSEFVTLSGSSGVITVALHNGLNQPIRVGLRQIDRERGSTVTVSPIAAVTLDPGERSTLRVNLSAQRVSVQEVTLTAVTAQGVPFGTPLTFTLRSSPVGAVVWAITIAVALVLAVLVYRRVRRRVRLRREASSS